MLISWIKQFIRVSVKGKFYTILNTLGLAVGLMCTIIIMLWADFQLSYDKFHLDFKKIFQVYNVWTYANGYKAYYYVTPAPLAEYLKEKYPEISSSSRFSNATGVLGMGNKAFSESRLGFTDSTFFNIFSVEFILGSKKHCLKDKSSIVVSEKLAVKLFGTNDIIGKTIRLNGRTELTVTAIIKDYPANSNVSFSCLIPFDNISLVGLRTTDWSNSSFSTYVKLDNTNNIEVLEKKITAELIKEKGYPETSTHNLYPLERVRLYTPDPNGMGLINIVIFLISIAGFVLILACINFINLITARAASRAKEVGIRKVVGSSRTQLVAQYFFESFLNTILSLFIAILLVDLTLPTFNAILGTNLVMNFSDFDFWSTIAIVVFCVGFVSGIYPALVLSSFQPVKVLKGIFRTGAKGVGFRKTMVIIQYTVTIFLVIITLFMVKQLYYISNKETGVKRENVYSIPFKNGMEVNYANFKNRLAKIPSVKYVTGTKQLPFQINSLTSGVSWSGKDTTQSYRFSHTYTDEFFNDVMEIKMVEGRYFSSEYSTDFSCIVINEAAAKVIDKKPILGEIITLWGDKVKVIGVMKDFQFTPKGKIEPLFIYYSTKAFSNILIKTQSSFDQQAKEEIIKVYSELYPDYLFELMSLEDEYQKMYSIEKQMKSILSQFTILAFLISCIGLLGLAAYIAEIQRKSLVLRKIHGASVARILIIQLSHFTKWVLISGIIAIPLSYLTVKKMFSSYAYQTELSWWVFAGALGAALIIAVITVLYQAIKTARVNPVEILKYE